MIKRKIFLSTVVSLMTISTFSGCGIASSVENTQVITSIPKDSYKIIEENNKAHEIKLIQEGKKAYVDNKEDEAINLFTQAIELNNSSEAMYVLGVVYLNKGNMKRKAMELFKQSSRLGNQKAIEILEMLGDNHAQ